MAINGIQLGDEILTAIDAAVAGSRVASPAQRVAIWRAIGVAIATHIQTNAQVVVNVVSVAGVTPGAGVSGPGTGTGSIL